MTVLEFLTTKSTVTSGTAYNIVTGISGVACSGVSDGIDIICMDIEEKEIVDVEFNDVEAIPLEIREIEEVVVDLEI